MNPGKLLHPDLVAMLAATPLPVINDESLAIVRGVNRTVKLSDAVERADYVVPGAATSPQIPVRVHRPKEYEGLLPCLYSMHGGGYVVGSYAMDDPKFDDLAPKLGLVGVSVDYRLAPETPYPGPLEDCYRALVWTLEHAEELGIDRTRVGIVGASAGGGLAAALALLARDRGEVSIAFQLLDSPMLDDRQITRSSQLDGLPTWPRETNAYGWKAYLGDLYGSDEVPHTAAAARADDLSGLPPAFVSVGSLDGFLDEDVAYALALNHADVPTELHVYPGACHGYQMSATCEITAQTRRDMQEWLARQIRPER